MRVFLVPNKLALTGVRKRLLLSEAILFCTIHRARPQNVPRLIYSHAFCDHG